ncbi:MAG: EF-hand domain-containing protein [Pararhodobacter sp.]
MRAMTLTALALMLSAVPALAQETNSPRGPVMLQAEFADIDADGDGRISLEEWMAYLAERRDERREQAILARVDALFDAADADADGVLTRDELAAGMATLHERRMAEMTERRAAHGAERRAGYREGHRHGSRHRHGAHMGRAGAGGEWAARSFARIDSNDDGVIVPEELAAAQERWQRHAERRAERRSERRSRTAD